MENNGFPKKDDGHHEFEFCTEGHCCQDRLKQPKVLSDNSCLPVEKLEAVEEDIKKANKLLLDLGLEDPERNKVIKEAFTGIEGLNVKVEIEAGQEDEVDGKVYFAGNDFVALFKDENEIMIPNERVSLIQVEGRFAEPISEPLLAEIDPCFRRELTFHFGRTVSSSPELIKIFFGMKLAIYLLLMQDKEISVKLEGEILDGVLWKVSEDSFTLRNEEKDREVNLAHVLYLTHKRNNEKE
ncbi:hypothetical protein [Bacillus sp. AK031]